MPLKAGSYQIEFKFEPDSYRIGNIIALVSSVLFVLWLLGFIYISWKKSTPSNGESRIGENIQKK